MSSSRYKTPYQTLREKILINNDYTAQDLENGEVSWTRIRNQMNEKVEEEVFRLSNAKIPASKIESAFISKVFKEIINSDRIRMDDVIDKCRITKNDVLKRLFYKPDKQRQDFNPKTKDFFAVYCEGTGWREFSSEARDRICFHDESEGEDSVINNYINKAECLGKDIDQLNGKVPDEKMLIKPEEQILNKHGKSDYIIEEHSLSNNLRQILGKNYDIKDLFYYIVFTKNRTQREYEIIAKYLHESSSSDSKQIILINAIILASFYQYESLNIKLLMNIVERKRHKVWQHALIGAILSLTTQYGRFKSLIEFRREYKIILDNPESQDIIQTLMCIVLDNLSFKYYCLPSGNIEFFSDEYNWCIPFTRENKDVLSFTEETDNQSNKKRIIDFLIKVDFLTNFEKFNYLFQLQKKTNNEVEKLLKDLENRNAKAKEIAKNGRIYRILNRTFKIYSEIIEVNKHFHEKYQGIKQVKYKRIIRPEFLFNIISENRFISIADEYFSKEYYKWSLIFFKKNLGRNPCSSSYSSIAKAYSAIGKHKEALYYYQQVSEEDERNILNINHIAKTYFELENYQEALTYCQRVLEIDDRDITANYYMSNCHLSMGNFDMMYKYLKKLDSIDPKNTGLLINWGNYFLNKGLIDKTIEYWEQALEIDNKNLDLLLGYIGCCLKIKLKREKLYSYIKEAHALGYSNIKVNWYIGNYHYFLGHNIFNATRFFEMVLDLTKDDCEKYSFLRDIYMKLGHIELLLKHEDEAYEYYLDCYYSLKNDKDFFLLFDKDSEEVEEKGIKQDVYKNIRAKLEMKIREIEIQEEFDRKNENFDNI